MTSKKISLAVFCSARASLPGAVFNLASDCARELAKRRWNLIYGGACVGLMGKLADEALKNKVPVFGYMPKDLFTREIPHPNLTQMIESRDMAERKQQMIRDADGFLILPGGLGTLDELLEVLTLKQLKCHNKPIVVINHNGFWDMLLKLFQSLIAQNVVEAEGLQLLFVCNSIEDAFIYFDEVL